MWVEACRILTGLPAGPPLLANWLPVHELVRHMLYRRSSKSTCPFAINYVYGAMLGTRCNCLRCRVPVVETPRPVTAVAPQLLNGRLTAHFPPGALFHYYGI